MILVVSVVNNKYWNNLILYCNLEVAKGAVALAA